MLTRISFYSLIVFLITNFSICNQLQFNSNWGAIYLSSEDKSINLEKLQEVIITHIDFINSNFHSPHKSPIYIKIQNKSLINNNNLWSWSLGVTKGENHIFLKSPALTHISINRFYKVVKHEIGHIFLNRLNIEIPKWFSEGFCLKYASEISKNHSLNVSKNLNNKMMFNIDSIDQKFNANNKRDFDFAYSLSAVIFNLMIELYGDQVINNIINNLKKNQQFDKAFYNSTLISLIDFNSNLYSEIKKKYRWIKLIKFPNILFLLFPFLLSIGFIIKKYNNKKKLQDWEIEELIEDSLNYDEKKDIN